MGLYDRDYMRVKPTQDDDEGPGLERLNARRRRMVMIGVIVMIAGILAMVLLN